MKERPILFSAPMVRAVLAGRKTQTRRVLQQQPNDHHWQTLPGHELRRSEMVTIDGRCAVKFSHSIPQNRSWDDASRWVCCPYGVPGDRLWVREAWRITGDSPDDTLDMFDRDDVQYRADDDQSYIDRYRPSIHMPRRFSRITLEVSGVRVEQLQAISEPDAIAEGMTRDGAGWYSGYLGSAAPAARPAYALLWDHLNGPAAWAANPWVWVIEFKRVEAC